MIPRPTHFLVRFTAAAAISLGLAACAQGTGEPTDESGQPIENVQAPAPTAAERAGKPGARGPHGDPAKMIEKLDQNKNGTLELSELPEHKREFLKDADTDKNGSLSIPELEAHKKQMGERMFGMRDDNKDGFLTENEVGAGHWSRMSVADADKDGKVSKAELEAAHRDGTLKPMMGPHHGKKMGEHMFAMQDENKDGFLTEAEVGKLHWSKLSVADADKDGKVSKAEIEAAHRDGTLMPPMGGPGGHHRGFFGKDPQKLIERFDADKNGTLELEELPEHKRDRLGTADANKDGQLSVAELKSHFDARMKERGARFGKP